MERKKTNRVEKKGKISMQLLVVLIPMIAIFIVVVAAIILGFASKAERYTALPTA